MLSNPEDTDEYTDNASVTSFKGRTAVIADFGEGNTELYLGDAHSLSYRGYSVAAKDDANTAASMTIKPGEKPIIKANSEVATMTK